MLTRLANGTIIDPAHGVNAVQRDIFIEDGRIVRAPAAMRKIDREYDLSGNIVMAGALDIHTHIGGGKVNIARVLLPEDHEQDPVAPSAGRRGGSGRAVPSTFVTGYRYAEMGYTACFEPAMLPANTRQAHLEMADIPIVDAGAYVLMGNDDFLLQLMSDGAPQALITDYVAWTMRATQALAVKVVNPGGINAFKFNQRKLDLDERHAVYDVTPRSILRALCTAVHDLGIPHPLHVHGCNLGVPGNDATTLDTITAADGLRMHLTHLQFHAYGKEGDRKFSSGAARIAERINAAQNISLDVGQIMFGRTVTASGDTMLQFRGAKHAHPKKTVTMDIECDAGCGVVPFNYRSRNFVNALQWCVGLELFLLINDPWRIFLTTDHPNGAPFTCYPHLIRLLMDREYRLEMLSGLHPAARQHSILASLTREYSLYEIAILTRAAPARSLGLGDRGHLGVGAAADVVVYRKRRNMEEMFSSPRLVFKDGKPVVQDGRIIDTPAGTVHRVAPEFDPAIARRLQRYFDRYHTVRLGNFRLGDDELLSYGRAGLSTHSCLPV
ncbi:MAG: formylmethanofuran dehydrogenase subunit A [Gammaproteobacteria bacterium]|nr:formylmethanofuran dehydrogenase subunit A [Gammaproteobacteria bacterium]